MSIDNDKKGAAVKFPPPLVFIFWIIVGYGFQQIQPVKIECVFPYNLIGWILIILGISIILFIRRTFTRAGTSIEPWEPTLNIITTGFYAYSRNPVYVLFCIVPMGIGILLNNFWILISLIPSIITVYFIAVKKEEAYLEEKFGDEYVQYKQKVRRWL